MKTPPVTWLAPVSSRRELSISDGESQMSEEDRQFVNRRARQGRIINYIFDNETDSDRAEIARLLNETLEQIRSQDAAARAVLNRLPALTPITFDNAPSYEGVYFNSIDAYHDMVTFMSARLDYLERKVASLEATVQQLKSGDPSAEK